MQLLIQRKEISGDKKTQRKHREASQVDSVALGDDITFAPESHRPVYDGSVWAELLEFPDGRSRERSSMLLCGGLTFAKRIAMKTTNINATKEQVEKTKKQNRQWIGLQF